MGRIVKIPGLVITGVLDMDWYFRLSNLNQTLHIIVGFSYIFVMGRFLLFPMGLAKSRRLANLTSRIKIAIGFCCVMQTADLLAFYWPRSVACTSISVISALCAATAIIRLPEILDVISTEIILGGIGGAIRPSQNPLNGTTLADTARYEQLKARVHVLEDDFRRCGWIAQSRNAMNQLTDLLAELEGVLDAERAEIGEK